MKPIPPSSDTLDWLLKVKRPLLTVKEVAAKLLVVRQTIYSLVEEAELEELRVGSQRRLTRRGVLLYLTKHWNKAPVVGEMLMIIGAWLPYHGNGVCPGCGGYAPDAIGTCDACDACDACDGQNTESSGGK